MTDIAVTGATGFLGRHVVAELGRRGISPTLVGRSPVDGASARTVIADLAAPPPRLFDLMDRPRVLIHLAWSGLPNYSSPHHMDDELPAQERVLRALVADGLPNLVVAGTCLEYGAQTGPLDEQCAAAPCVSYAIAKDRLRRDLEELRGQTPFGLTWARLFYMFGAGQAPTSLYAQLEAAVARGDKTFAMSGGAQIRDYLPVSEVAAALVDLAVLGADVGVVNVCSGRPISVRDLVETWIAEHGWAIEPRLGVYPYPEHEPMSFWGDPSKLRCVLGRS